MQKTIDRNPIVRIAVRHLLSKKKQTLVAVLGVTFGIAAFIFQAGIITGHSVLFQRQNHRVVCTYSFIQGKSNGERKYLGT